jgi:hypothetical protein
VTGIWTVKVSKCSIQTAFNRGHLSWSVQWKEWENC